MGVSIDTIRYPENWGNDEINGIVEVQPPPDISWMPQTMGWAIVAALLGAPLLYAVYLAVRRYHRNAYRREALEELSNLDAQKDYHLLPRLLRRTALSAYPRDQVAALSGLEWETWLDQKCPGCQFASAYRGQLSKLAYARKRHLDASALCQQVSLWIKKHEAVA